MMVPGCSSHQVLYSELCLDQKCSHKLSRTSVQKFTSTSESVVSSSFQLHIVQCIHVQVKILLPHYSSVNYRTTILYHDWYYSIDRYRTHPLHLLY